MAIQEAALMGTIANAILAVGLHELAHIAAASALGVRVYQVGMSRRGPFSRRDPGSTSQNLAITLAGPGINLLLALILHRTSPSFALNNLVLGICNLLPFPSSDGSRALSLLQLMRKRFVFRSHPEQECGEGVVIGISSDECRDEAA
jgi:Zn-dependent protease